MDNELTNEALIHKITEEARALNNTANIVKEVLMETRPLSAKIAILQIMTEGIEKEIHEFNIWLKQQKEVQNG
jgi:hypothetical protein